jgi:hypothetical protein
VGFLAILIALVGFGHWWDRRRVREAFEAYGHDVQSVRWVPFELRLNARRVTVFAVTYSAKDGSRWRCRAEAKMFGDLFLEEPVPLDPAVSPSGAGTAAVVGVRPQPARHPARFRTAALACAATCSLLIGATFWTAPYDTLDLPDSLYGPALLVLVAAAAGLRFSYPARTAAIVAILAGAVVAVILIRIAADVAKDPTRHNLWPFEIVIAAFVGAAAAGAGVGLGSIARRLS